MLAESNYLYPAYLWFGDYYQLNKEVAIFLKNIYCQNKKQNIFCDTCIKCIQVDQKQHSNIRFIEPVGGYTLSDLKIIFSTISFSLSEDETFFFILNNADTLSAVCANSLLKSLEEPPSGYHFILLAQRKEGILPTIISRCIVKNFIPDISKENKLVSYLISPNIKSSNNFNYELDSQKLFERDVISIIDQLERYWLEYYKQAILENNSTNTKKAQRVIDILNKFREYPPMPGSAKIALKNLYLNLLDL